MKGNFTHCQITIQQALTIMKELGLTPKRTMRMVMWTGEETGIDGAYQYYDRHQVKHQLFTNIPTVIIYLHMIYRTDIFITEFGT